MKFKLDIIKNLLREVEGFGPVTLQQPLKHLSTVLQPTTHVDDKFIR